MEFKKINIKIDKINDEIPLTEGGDGHVGPRNYYEKGFVEMIDQIIENNGYFLNMGDHVDDIAPKDPRFDMGVMDNRFAVGGKYDIGGGFIGNCYAHWEAQLQRIVDELGSDHILGILGGNHGSQATKRSAFNETALACKRLKTPYLSDEAIIKLNLIYRGKKQKTYELYVCHGWGGGGTTGGKVNRVEKTMEWCKADSYDSGHFHIVHEWANVRLFGNNGINHKVIPISITGSFYLSHKQGVNGYDARYRPLPLGYIIKHISKNKMWNKAEYL